jgi:hypothetical protein
MAHDDPALGQPAANLRYGQIRLGLHQSQQKVTMLPQLRMMIAAHRPGLNRTSLFLELAPPDRARNAHPKPRRRGMT